MVWNVCVLMCACCVGKDSIAHGIQCCSCSALRSPSRSVRSFLHHHFQAPIPSHPLTCLSLDANMGQAQAHKVPAPHKGHHHKPDTQGTENGRRNLIGRGWEGSEEETKPKFVWIKHSIYHAIRKVVSSYDRQGRIAESETRDTA